MKKLFYLIVTLAFVFSGPMMASADRVFVPITYHYATGSSVDNYTLIAVKNLASEQMNVTVNFMASSQLTLQTGSVTQHSGKSVGTKIPAYGTWLVSSADSGVWGTTTTSYMAKVEVQSSGTDHPYVEGASYNSNGTGLRGTGMGPIAVNTLFVSVAGGSAPSGFVFPTYYRIRSWASSDASGGAVTGAVYTVDNWGQ